MKLEGKYHFSFPQKVLVFKNISSLQNQNFSFSSRKREIMFQKLPKAMTSSLSTTTGQCDHVTTRAITVETVASSGRYKSQGVSANFVSCLSQGTCVDCGLPEDPLPGLAFLPPRKKLFEPVPR